MENINEKDEIKEYIMYYKIGQNEIKENIFTIANKYKYNLNILIGLIDGIISRNDNILNNNILNDFLNEYGNFFTNDILFPSLEHSLIVNNINSAKLIVKYINKYDDFLDYHKKNTMKFLKDKNIELEILKLI
jgi:hypothetical protein